jgi:hypothetical protein
MCMDFIIVTISSFGRLGKRVHYKHIFYILQHVIYYGQIEEFIHHLTWSWNKFEWVTSHVKQVIIVMCKEWSTIQNCKLVMCVDGQYIVCLCTFVLCSLIWFYSWMWNVRKCMSFMLLNVERKNIKNKIFNIINIIYKLVHTI